MNYTERYERDKIMYLQKVLKEDPKLLVDNKDEEKEQAQKSIIKRLLDHCSKNKCIIDVSYTQNDDRGRYYARTPSIQMINKKVRGFLCTGMTTDIDIKNCYPTILKKICDDNGIICNDLTMYVNDREKILTKYPSQYEEIKKDIFQIIFGKNVKTTIPFVEKFKSEMKSITDELVKIDAYKKYYEQSTHKNPKASCTFKIIEDIEIEVVKEAIAHLGIKNQTVFTYMFDGIMINGNRYDDIELLDGLNAEIRKKYPYIEFVYKKHNEELVEKYIEYFSKKEEEQSQSTDLLSYEDKKKEFELTHAKIINAPCYIRETKKNGKLEKVSMLSQGEMSTAYGHYHCTFYNAKKDETKTIPFLPNWLLDHTMRTYEDMDFYPPGVECPSKNYNLWTCFEAEYITDHIEKKEELEMVLNHLKIMCGHDENMYNYFTKWIAHLIKYPSKKSTCPVFISGPGAGKGTMMQLFKSMLGNNKVFESTSPERDVWGSFNSEMLNCYLVNLNEIGKKQQNDSTGKIKALLTDHQMFINQKGLKGTNIISYHKFIITTNNEDPVQTSSDDRRYVIIRCSDEKIGDREYFETLNEILIDKNVIKTCFDYFCSIEVKENYLSVLPKPTEYHMEIKEVNKHWIEFFLEFYCRKYDKESTKTTTPRQFYEDFQEYKNAYGVSHETSSIKLMLALSLSRFKKYTKKENNGGRKTHMDLKAIAKELNINVSEQETSVIYFKALDDDEKEAKD